MNDWQCVPARRVFDVVQGGTPTADAQNWNGDIPWATPVDLAPRHGGFLDSTARSLTDTGLRTGSRAVPADSLILSTRAPIGYVVQNKMRTALNQGCKALVPRSPIDVRYFRYQFSALALTLAGMGQGATFMELSRDALSSFPVVAPALPEQRAIADFLDRETARIDRLIETKRKMLDYLAERAAGLVETEIRGLAFKHDETRLKYVAGSINVGIVITPAAWYAPTGVLAIRGVNVRPWEFDLNDVVYLSQEGHDLHRKSQLKEGDLVVVRTGQAGAAAVVPASLAGSNCIDLLIVRPRDVAPEYLAYVLNSDWATKHIAQYSVGTIQSHFNVSALKDLPVPVPSVEQQVAVVRKLDRRLSGVEQIRDRLNRQLRLLAEHRQALVTAAVIGQLEVPAAA